VWCEGVDHHHRTLQHNQKIDQTGHDKLWTDKKI
jgi:hypothetical protein